MPRFAASIVIMYVCTRVDSNATIQIYVTISSFYYIRNSCRAPQ